MCAPAKLMCPLPSIKATARSAAATFLPTAAARAPPTCPPPPRQRQHPFLRLGSCRQKSHGRRRHAPSPHGQQQDRCSPSRRRRQRRLSRHRIACPRHVQCRDRRQRLELRRQPRNWRHPFYPPPPRLGPPPHRHLQHRCSVVHRYRQRRHGRHPLEPSPQRLGHPRERPKKSIAAPGMAATARCGKGAASLPRPSHRRQLHGLLRLGRQRQRRHGLHRLFIGICSDYSAGRGLIATASGGTDATDVRLRPTDLGDVPNRQRPAAAALSPSP